LQKSRKCSAESSDDSSSSPSAAP